MDLNVHLSRSHRDLNGPQYVPLSRSHRDLNGPQCPFLAVPPRPKWTSMSISGGSNRMLLDLNVHIWRFPPHIIVPQCPYGTIGIPCGGSMMLDQQGASKADFLRFPSMGRQDPHFKVQIATQNHEIRSNLHRIISNNMKY